MSLQAAPAADRLFFGSALALRPTTGKIANYFTDTFKIEDDRNATRSSRNTASNLDDQR
jgi:hypothetical protein